MPYLSLFTVLFAYVAFSGGCLVIMGLCRSGCRQNFANSSSFFFIDSGKLDLGLVSAGTWL